jgi:hypothetical protein
MYQLLNNHLVKDIAKDVNEAKRIFNQTLGSSAFRARIYQQTFAKARAMLVGAQECKNPVFAKLMEEIGFHPTAQQKSSDGSKVFLHTDFFEPDYETLELTVINRLGKVDKEGKAMGVLATRKGTGQKVLAGTCHGSAKDPTDILRQIDALYEKFKELQIQYPDLVFTLFVDANPNDQAEEEAFLLALKTRGLKATSLPTTSLKTRAVTVMHGKSYEEIARRKDFIVVPEWQELEDESIAFAQSLETPLPNLENPSDHGAVGAVIYPIKV